MVSVAVTLAEWAAELEPDREDLELAHRSLLDTVAVTLAARDHRVTRLAEVLPEGARWAVAGHVLDFDDLHMPSTTHVSVVCVPTALATGGGARAYLAAAGVMARLGTFRKQGRTVVASVGIYGAATVAFGLSRLFWLSLLMLAITGAADTVSTVLRQTIRQLSTPNSLRGRMTSINMVFFMGGPQSGPDR